MPEQFRDRKLYQHNASVTLMRTTPEENDRIGVEIGRKASQATGPTVILLPERGVSAIDRTGQPFDDPAARRALFGAIRRTAGATEILSLDCHINDPHFAEEAATRLLALMKLPQQQSPRDN